MRNTMQGLLLLVTVLTTAGFPGCGANVKPNACPSAVPLPRKLQDRTDYAERVRRELFGTSKPSSRSGTN